MRIRHILRAARGVVPLGLAALLLAPAVASADHGTPTPLERRVKAAFLYKFAGYVEWPGTAFHGVDDPLVIGVVDDEALAAELERLVLGRRSAGHPVLVRRIEDVEDPGNIHLLFVSRAGAHQTADILRAIHLRPVLVVTETKGALEQGSMINFVLDEGRVRFEVNLDAVERNGLGLSSRLLTVARSVSARRS